MRPLLACLVVATLLSACTDKASSRGGLGNEADGRQIREVEVAVDSGLSEDIDPSWSYPHEQPSDSSEWDAIGKPCTEDCSGHEAGYQWAEEKGIGHHDDCGGNSQSFIEGCEAYAEDVQRDRISDGQCEDLDGDGLCD